MKLLLKNNIISQLLKLGVVKEDLDKITVLYENVFKLSCEEKIIPGKNDENLYILHDNQVLYKNYKYILEENINNLSIKKQENINNLKSVNFTIKEFDTIFNLSSCKITDFGLLVPLNDTQYI